MSWQKSPNALSKRTYVLSLAAPQPHNKVASRSTTVKKKDKSNGTNNFDRPVTMFSDDDYNQAMNRAQISKVWNTTFLCCRGTKTNDE